MNRTILIISVGLMLGACGGDEPTQETISFDDLAGETGEEAVDTSGEFVQVFDDSKRVNQLANMIAPDFDTSSASISHPMDRFGFSNTEKMQFKGKETVPYGSSMVTPVADFFYFSFADSNKTINAFYNYLDIMAEEGEGGPVRLNEDVESIKSPPLFMAVYDTIIISAEYQCEHEEQNWKPFQDSIFNLYGNNYKYLIQVDCGGPLKWEE